MPSARKGLLLNWTAFLVIYTYCVRIGGKIVPTKRRHVNTHVSHKTNGILRMIALPKGRMRENLHFSLKGNTWVPVRKTSYMICLTRKSFHIILNSYRQLWWQWQLDLHWSPIITIRLKGTAPCIHNLCPAKAIRVFNLIKPKVNKQGACPVQIFSSCYLQFT